MAAEGAADSDMIAFDCTTLNRLLAEAGRTRIDVLKLDIEGAEYAVIDRLLRDGLEVGQLCVEIHTHHHSGAGTGLLDALLLILRLYRAGYRIVYNTAMDFTFVHKSMLP